MSAQSLDSAFHRTEVSKFYQAQIMNYLGAREIDSRVKAAVAVSTPIQLKSSAETLKKGFNRVYLKNFTRKISKKLNETR